MRFFVTQTPPKEPDIPQETIQAMQGELKKFEQAMSLGKHKEAQEILDVYKVQIDKYFTEDHPAQLAAANNQALLNRFDGQF